LLITFSLLGTAFLGVGEAAMEPGQVASNGFSDRWNQGLAECNLSLGREALTRSLEFTFRGGPQSSIDGLETAFWIPPAASRLGVICEMKWLREDSRPDVSCEENAFNFGAFDLVSAPALITELDSLNFGAIAPEPAEYAAYIEVNRTEGLPLGVKANEADYVFRQGKLVRVSASKPLAAAGMTVVLHVFPVGSTMASPETNVAVLLADLGAKVTPLRLPARAVPPGEIVADFRLGDVNGDGRKEQVYVLAQPVPDSPLLKSPRLVLYTPRGCVKYDLPDEEQTAYEYRLDVRDLTGDRKAEILIVDDLDGSGAVHLLNVYQSQDGVLARIFAAKKAAPVPGARSTLVKDVFTLEIIPRHLKWKIPTPRDAPRDLPLIEDPAFIDPFSGYDLVDLDGDGTKEIMGHQRVAYYVHVNIMGDLRQVFKWDGERYVLWKTMFFQGFQWFVAPVKPMIGFEW
jgi:hypothetical protein